MIDQQRNRDQTAQRKREKQESVREIGFIPRCKNPERRASCENDLPLFLMTYMPMSFYLGWSADQKKSLAKLQAGVLGGGLFALAAPRGDGKTTRSGGAATWAIAYGHREFVVVIGAEAQHAKNILEGICMEFSQNELLAEDFPEICYPVKHIDGIAQRATGQMYNGDRTHISWKSDKVVFPFIDHPDIKCAGSVIAPKGLTGAIRGMSHKKPDGRTLRPDFVLLDDPQTEESAKSVTQCNDRESLVSKAVLGLAGPDTRISAAMLCTVIQKGDLSDRFLDHELHPEWQGECTKMVYEWPESQDELWSEYAEIRRSGLVDGDLGEAGNKFYAEHREAMDKGAVVAWEERKNPDELSALQHAENLRIDRGEAAFFSEYQNDPIAAHPALYEITMEAVCEKVNGFPHLWVPDTSIHVSGFIDVNPAYGLHWVTAWFAPDMTGGVIDYGKWPRHEKKSLITEFPGVSEDVAIFKGMDSLMTELDMKEVKCGGERGGIDLMMIDCGYKMKTMFNWVRANDRRYKNIRHLVCSRGWGSRRYKQNKNALRVGENLHLTEWVGKGRVIVHNADYWRVYAQKAFLLPRGAPSSLGVYGDKPKDHARLGEHVSSEQLVEFLKGDIADSYNWHITPGTHNDLLDGVVGCCVGASYRGCNPNVERLPVQKKKAVVPRRRDFQQHSI